MNTAINKFQIVKNSKVQLNNLSFDFVMNKFSNYNRSCDFLRAVIIFGKATESNLSNCGKPNLKRRVLIQTTEPKSDCHNFSSIVRTT